MIATVITTPQPSDFVQRYVPSPTELNGNFSPDRIIKQSAAMQIHVSDSFQIAAETVNVGEKYRTAFRTTIMANNAIASPTHVIGDTRCAPGTQKEAVDMMIMMRSGSRLDAELS